MEVPWKFHGDTISSMRSWTRRSIHTLYRSITRSLQRRVSTKRIGLSVNEVMVSVDEGTGQSVFVGRKN